MKLLYYEIKMIIKNLGNMQGPENKNPSKIDSPHFGTEQAN